MQRVAIQLAAFLFGVTFCGVVNADAGGPLLLIINLYVFSLGQVWILLSEFVYLFMRMPPGTQQVQVSKLVLLLNFWSTLGGAFLIPLAWSVCFLGFAAAARKDLTASNVLAYVGNWAMPGESEFSWLLIPSTALLFLITFAGTVAIEFKLLNHWRERYGLPDRKTLKRWTIEMNLISYLGLIVFFAGGLLAYRH